MHIQEIQIVVNKLDRDTLLVFYKDTLGLPTSPNDVRIGTSHLMFFQSDIVFGLPSKAQHFAINIPENQIEAAHDWLIARVPLIESNGQTIFYFENWNAHAIYFRDPVGNIVELIARHTLDNASDVPFSAESLLCVSEIGLPADDVPAVVQMLKRDYNLDVYGTPSDTFTAVGDENGLLIIVSSGREWFPHTGVTADDGCYNIKINTPLSVDNQSAQKEALLQSALPDEAVQQDFVGYWDQVERFFSEPSGSRAFAKMETMLAIVRHLRHSGIERLLRPGSQLSTFILSRSLKYGLRHDQATLSIFAGFDDLTYLTYFSGAIIKNTPIRVEYITTDFIGSTEGESMLIRLLTHPFN